MSPSMSRSPATWARARPSSPGAHSRRRRAIGGVHDDGERGVLWSHLAPVPRPQGEGQLTAEQVVHQWFDRAGDAAAG